MLFVDEITEFNRFKEIYKSRNKFILKIDKLKFTKLNEIIYKCIFYYMKIFNKNIKKIIDLDDDGLKLNILYIINEKNEKLKFVENNKIKNRLISKINIRREKNRNLRILRNIKKIKKYNFKNVILSNNLFNDEKLKKIFINNNINIIEGKFLYESLLYKSIEYISNIQRMGMEKYEISILIKYKNNIRVSGIIELAKKCKIINLITDNIRQFDRLEKELKKEYGIILNVTTNKDKTLLNSNIIINLDFLLDEFSQCVLPRKAIIFNIRNNLKIYSNFFEGINITDYLIYLPQKYNKIVKLLEDVNPILLYEAIIIENNLIQSEIERKLKFDSVEIKCFLGNNGIIRGREFLKVKRIKKLKEKLPKDLTKKYNNRNIVPLVKNQT